MSKELTVHLSADQVQYLKQYLGNHALSAFHEPKVKRKLRQEILHKLGK